MMKYICTFVNFDADFCPNVLLGGVLLYFMKGLAC